MRYFVRSYVTSPTTIRAITEIPANTPRPIGRTDRCFPGSVKEPSDEFDDEVASAAADAATGTGDVVVVAALAPAVEAVDAGDVGAGGGMPRVVTGVGSVCVGVEDAVELLLSDEEIVVVEL